MAKSSSTPIEFSAKAYLVAAILTWVLAVVAFISAVEVDTTSARAIALVGMVFWAIISFLCIRAWRARK